MLNKFPRIPTQLPRSHITGQINFQNGEILIVLCEMSFDRTNVHYGFHKQCSRSEIEQFQVNRSCSGRNVVSTRFPACLLNNASTDR